MKIVWVDIDDLLPAAYNPRTHSGEDELHLTESITKFGAVEPILANCAKNRLNIVISGHFRLKIYRKLGYKKVPVVYIDIPDIEREKELNLRMNRNTGDWNWDLLKEYDIGFLGDVGFNEADLIRIFDDVSEAENDDFNVDEELEKLTDPVTKLGDLRRLGDHFLLCADATDPDAMRRLVGKNRINVVYHDPIFNIGHSYDRGVSGKKKKKRYGGTTDDNKSDEDYRKFLKAILANSLAVAKPDCHVFCYSDQAYTGMLQSLYAELGIDFKRTCLWIKNNANITPQIAFSKIYECCQYGVVGSPYLSDRAQNFTEILNKEVGTGNRTIDDILDIIDVWLCKRLPSQEYQHAAQKPVTLHEKPLRRCTRPGDAVLDACAGSGSTLIACEQMKRRAFVMDIEPRFCDLIIHRWETLTGLKSSLVAHE